MIIKKSDVRNLGKSFLHAWGGIAYCVKNERNMRIHICVTILVALFAFYYKATAWECAAIFIAIGLVLSSEMVNTAIETLVNLASPSYDNLAKIAKDVAAGAVFVNALAAVVVALFVFVQPQRLVLAFARIFADPIAIIVFLASLIIGTLFIFYGPHLFGEKTMRIYTIKEKHKHEKNK